MATELQDQTGFPWESISEGGAPKKPDEFEAAKPPTPASVLASPTEKGDESWRKLRPRDFLTNPKWHVFPTDVKEYMLSEVWPEYKGLDPQRRSFYLDSAKYSPRFWSDGYAKIDADEAAARAPKVPPKSILGTIKETAVEGAKGFARMYGLPSEIGLPPPPKQVGWPESKPPVSPVTGEDVWTKADRYAAMYGVDPMINRAIILAESDGNPTAIRTEDNKTRSRGLYQWNDRGRGAGVDDKLVYDPDYVIPKSLEYIKPVYDEGVRRGLSGKDLALYIAKNAQIYDEEKGRTRWERSWDKLEAGGPLPNQATVYPPAAPAQAAPTEPAVPAAAPLAMVPSHKVGEYALTPPPAVVKPTGKAPSVAAAPPAPTDMIPDIDPLTGSIKGFRKRTWEEATQAAEAKIPRGEENLRFLMADAEQRAARLKAYSETIDKQRAAIDQAKATAASEAEVAGVNSTINSYNQSLANFKLAHEDYVSRVDQLQRLSAKASVDVDRQRLESLTQTASDVGFLKNLATTTLSSYLTNLTSQIGKGLGALQTMVALGVAPSEPGPEEKRKSYKGIPLKGQLAPPAGKEALKGVTREDIVSRQYLEDMKRRVAELQPKTEEVKQYYESTTLKRWSDSLEQSINRLIPTNPAFADSFATQLAQGTGSMAAFVTLAALGRLVGLPHYATVAGAGALVQTPQEFELAINKAKTPEQIQKVFIVNLGLGATEALPIEHLLDKFDKATGGWATRWIKSYARRVVSGESARQGMEEMLQEFIQQLGSNVMARETYDPTRSPTESLVSNSLSGLILGAAFGGIAARVGVANSRANMKALGLTGEQIKGLEKEAKNYEDNLNRALEEQKKQKQAPPVVTEVTPAEAPPAPVPPPEAAAPAVEAPPEVPPSVEVPAPGPVRQPVLGGTLTTYPPIPIGGAVSAPVEAVSPVEAPAPPAEVPPAAPELPAPPPTAEVPPEAPPAAPAPAPAPSVPLSLTSPAINSIYFGHMENLSKGPYWQPPTEETVGNVANNIAWAVAAKAKNEGLLEDMPEIGEEQVDALTKEIEADLRKNLAPVGIEAPPVEVPPVEEIPAPPAIEVVPPPAPEVPGTGITAEDIKATVPRTHLDVGVIGGLTRLGYTDRQAHQLRPAEAHERIQGQAQGAPIDPKTRTYNVFQNESGSFVVYSPNGLIQPGVYPSVNAALDAARMKQSTHNALMNRDENWGLDLIPPNEEPAPKEEEPGELPTPPSATEPPPVPAPQPKIAPPLGSIPYFPTKIDSLSYHRATLALVSGAAFPVLKNARVKSGIMTTTDLDVWTLTDTTLPDGVYQLVGKEWVLNPEIDLAGFPEGPQEDLLLTDEKSITQRVRLTGIQSLMDAATAVSEEETRYVLRDVAVDVENGRATLVGTDGHRLYISPSFEASHLAPEAGAELGQPYIALRIPKDAINVLLKDKRAPLIDVFSSTDKNGQRWTFLDNGNVSIVARETAGQFPKHRMVIPKRVERQLKVNKDQLLDAMDQIKGYLDPKLKSVLIQPPVNGKVMIYTEDLNRKISKTVMIDGELVKIQKKGSPRGSNFTIVMPMKYEAHEFVPDPETPGELKIEVSGKPDHSFALNPDYLIDAAKATSGDDIWFSHKSANSSDIAEDPITISPNSLLDEDPGGVVATTPKKVKASDIPKRPPPPAVEPEPPKGEMPAPPEPVPVGEPADMRGIVLGKPLSPDELGAIKGRLKKHVNPSSPSVPTTAVKELVQSLRQEQGPEVMKELVRDKATGTMRAVPTINRRGFNMLGLKIYEGKDPAEITTRELLQNVIDAMKGLKDRSKGVASIYLDPFDNTITVNDNGVGMTRDQLASAFVDPFASAKFDEEGNLIQDPSGGLGIGLIAAFQSMEWFKARSIARRGSRYQENEIGGTGDQYMTGEGFVFTHSDMNSPLRETGTEITFRLKSKYELDWRVENYLRKFLDFHDLPFTFNFRRGHRIIEPTEGAREKWQKSGSLDLPSCAVDIYLDAKSTPSRTSYVNATVRVNGMPQFREDYALNRSVEITDDILVDVHPKAPPDDPTILYPITNDRGNTSPEVKKAIGQWLKENLEDLAAQRERDRNDNILYHGIPISGSKAWVVDANDPPVPDAIKQRIANDPAVRDIMNVLQRGYEKVKDILEERFSAHRLGLDRATVHGVSLISNEYGSIVRGDLKAGWQFDPDTPLTMLINLWRTYEKVGVDQSDEGKYGADYAIEHYAQFLCDTILSHEPAHIAEWNHGQGHGSLVQNYIGQSAPVTGYIKNAIQEVLSRDNYAGWNSLKETYELLSGVWTTVDLLAQISAHDASSEPTGDQVRAGVYRQPGIRPEDILRERTPDEKAVGEASAAMGIGQTGDLSDLDRQTMTDLLKLGAHHYLETRIYAEWVQRVIDDSDPSFMPYMKPAWDMIQEIAQEVEIEKGAPPPEEPEDVLQARKREALINAVRDGLASDINFTNPKLTELANGIFGGTRGEGKFTVREMYDCFEAGVAAYIERASLVDFTDPISTVGRLSSLTERLVTQTDRSVGQVELQQFSSPPVHAFTAVMAAMGQSSGTLTFLEPSAGTGMIATMARIYKAQVQTNEIDPERVAILKQRGFNPTVIDALHLNVTGHALSDYHPAVITMNPPFSAGPGGMKSTDFGARHVSHALAQLAPGGRLVAIVSDSMKRSAPKFSKWWKAIDGKYRVKADVGLSGASYRKFGASYPQRLLVIDKTGPTSTEDRAQIITGDDLLPAQAADLLMPLAREDIYGRFSAGAGETGIAPPPAIRRPGAPEGQPIGKPDVGIGGPPGGAEHPGPKPPTAAGVHVPVSGRPGGGAGLPGPPNGEGKFPGAPGLEEVGQVGGGVDTGVPGRAEPVPGELTLSEKQKSDLTVEDTKNYVDWVDEDPIEGSQKPASKLVTTPAMASVPSPPNSLVPNLPKELITSGALNSAQLHMIRYAAKRLDSFLANGKRRTYLVGDGTGFGKGREYAGLIYHYLRENGLKKAVWISASQALVADATRDAEALQIPLPIIHQNESKFGQNRPITGDGILFTQYETAAHDWKGKRERFLQLANWMGPDFEGVVVLDECFVYETLVLTDQGSIPIGEIVEKRLPVKVLSYNKDDHRYEWKPVIRWLPKLLTGPLVKVTHEYGSFICTPNHRIWTDSDYVRADNLSDRNLCVLPEALYSCGQGKESESEEAFLQLQVRSDMALASSRATGTASSDSAEGAQRLEPRQEITRVIGSDEIAQPHVESGRGRKDEADAHEKRMDYPMPRWERPDDGSAEDAVGSHVASDGARYSDPTGDGAISIFAKPLQGRPRGTGHEDSYRDRRKLSQEQEDEILGQAENPGSRVSRVVSVEILKPGSSGGYGSSDRPHQTVYDLEVSDNHNYFAAGVLVSNCHSLKNAIAIGQGGRMTEGSDRGAMAILLSENFPKARILLGSATAATENHNLSYMDRMGMWGPGCAFPDFAGFLNAMRAGGLGAMEALAREFKALGGMCSRIVSYDGAEYHPLECPLNDYQIEQYNGAASLWSELNEAMGEAEKNSNAKRSGKRWGAFQSAQQRFFLMLMTTYKAKTVLDDAKNMIDTGHAVVISLVNTNEATMKRAIAEAETKGESLEEMDIGPKQLVSDYIRKWFPLEEFEDVPDEENPERTKNVVKYVEVDDPDNPGQKKMVPAINQENLARQQELLAATDHLNLPDNPIDLVGQYFGGWTKVAEVSGRKSRIENGKEVKRTSPGATRQTNDAISNAEMRRFRNGDVNAIVITGAGATGISLHCAPDDLNQRRRVMYPMQLQWSADKTMQSLGRVLRTGQTSPPIYKLPMTNVKGEMRLVNAVGRRLASLGASSRGGRESMSGNLFEIEDLTDSYGRTALISTCHELLGETFVHPDMDGHTILDKMGFLNKDGTGIAKNYDTDVDLFLNRIMVLPFAVQNAVFERFYQHHQQYIQDAKDNGTFDTGITKVRGTDIIVVKEELLNTDKESGARTNLVEMEGQIANERLPWDLLERLYLGKIGNLGFFTNKHSKRIYIAREIFDPQTGERTIDLLGTRYTRTKVSIDDFKNNYEKENIDPSTDIKRLKEIQESESRKMLEAEKAIGKHERDIQREIETYEAEGGLLPRPPEPAPPMFGIERANYLWNKEERAIPVTKTARVYMITGPIFSIYDKIMGEEGLAKLRVSRAVLKDGTGRIGFEVKANEIAGLKVRLGIGNALKDLTPLEVYQTVRAGATLEFANRWRIFMSAPIHGEQRMEINIARGSQSREYVTSWMKSAGDMVVEIIPPSYNARFFVPLDDEKGPRMVEKLLTYRDNNPIITVISTGEVARPNQSGAAGTGAGTGSAASRISVDASGVRDLDLGTGDAPQTDDQAMEAADFWVREALNAANRILSGSGVADDQRMVHKAPIIAQHLVNWLDNHNDGVWDDEADVVSQAVRESDRHRMNAVPYDGQYAAAEARHYLPFLEEIALRVGAEIQARPLGSAVEAGLEPPPIEIGLEEEEPGVYRMASPPPEATPPGMPPPPPPGGTISAILPPPPVPPFPGTAPPRSAGQMIKRNELLRKLADGLGVKIRFGHFRQKAAGITKMKKAVIRTKKSYDMGVSFHEVGHWLNRILWGMMGEEPNWRPFEPFAGELQPIATKPAANQTNLNEGFAEFFRMFLDDPATAQRRCPTFFRYFTDTLNNNADVKDIVMTAQEDWRRWNVMPAKAKTLSHLAYVYPKADQNLWENLYTGFIDRCRPIQRIRLLLEEAASKKVPFDEDPYALKRLAVAWVYKGDHWIKKGPFHARTLEATGGTAFADIVQSIRENVEDVRAALVALRGLEKSYQGKEIGLTRSVLATTLDELGIDPVTKQARTPEAQALLQAADQFYEFNDQLLRYLVQAEVISIELYNKIKPLNRFYVPFYRLYESSIGEMSAIKKKGGGEKVGDLWNPVKMMKGDARPIMDPLLTMLQNIYTFVNIAERNMIGVALDKLADLDKSGTWVERIPTPVVPNSFALNEIKKTLEQAGIDTDDDTIDLDTIATVFHPKPVGIPKENVITVRIKGRPQLLQLHPDLYEAVMSSDTEAINPPLYWLTIPSQMLRLGATALNPEFAGKNLIRDIFNTFMQTDVGYIPGLSAYQGLMTALSKDERYWEWYRGGGPNVAMASIDRAHIERTVKELLMSPKEQTLHALTNPFELLKRMSEFSEECNRLATFDLARKQGMSIRESSFASREGGIDFRRIGAWMSGFNHMIPFLNPAIQDPDLFVRLHRKNPKLALLKGMICALIGLIASWLNRDDDKYEELPDWQKGVAWLLPTDGIPFVDNATPWVAIPKPFTWGAIYSNPMERLFSQTYKGNEDAWDGFIKSTLSFILPPAVPTILSPVFAMANWNSFLWRPIEPTWMREGRYALPVEQRAQWYTRETVVQMARGLAKIGIKVSPMKLEYVLYGLGGGSARIATYFTDKGLEVVGVHGPIKPSERIIDIPILRAFAVRYPTASLKSIQRVDDKVSELQSRRNAHMQDQRGNLRFPAPPLTDEEQRELGALAGAHAIISGLNRQMRRMIKEPDLTPEQKRHAVDSIYTEMVTVARNALDITEGAMEPPPEGIREGPRKPERFEWPAGSLKRGRAVREAVSEGLPAPPQ